MKMKNISERENYLRAIEFRNPQWIPIRFEFSPAVWKKYGKKLEEVILRHPLIFSDYAKGQRTFFDENDPLFKENTYYIDDWGCGWYNVQDGNLGQVIEHPLADWEALNTLKIPDPLKQADWGKLKKKVEADKRMGLPAIGEPESFAHGGFFDRLQFLRGLENLLVDFITEPPQLDTLIEILLDYNMKYIRKWLEIGVDVMWLHGDIGAQNGLMFSPKVFRRYLKPAYKKMFQTCRKAGTHVWYSSDGNLLEIIDDLIECGVSIHDPQVRANTIEGITKAYKGRLCALVDIDEQMLPFCKSEDIRTQISKVVEKLGFPKGGLMIFAIPSQDVPLENIEAICLAWEKYCFYDWP